VVARKRAVIHTETLRHTGVIIGPVRIVHPAILAAGCPWQYDHHRHGYKVPRQNLGDVEAALVASGYTVQARL
jgi:hypothetical protein